MEITLIAAQSLDGFITRHAEPGTAFTSSEDQRHFAAALQRHDASIMGGETYRVSRDFIRDRLTLARRRVVLTRTPEQFAGDAVPGRLEFTAEPVEALVARLRSLGHRSCALLGGAQIHQLFLARGLVDGLELTLEPRLFGRGTPLVHGLADVQLQLIDCRPLEASSTLLARYRVLRA
jgi:dihydrofolate reductase